MLSFTAIISAIAPSAENNTITNSYNDDSHIIKNPRVPYVGQNNDSFCVFASIAMLIGYHGFNTTLQEILHHSGFGYSQLYYGISILSRIPMGGSGVGQMSFNMEFLAQLYNLSFHDYTITGNQSPDILWDRYWSRVKNLILTDTPIETSVDPLSLPYYRNKFNITDNETYGGHAIVLVGFNESNETVCYNDPGTAIFNEEKNGTYTFVEYEIFREAVENTGGQKYHIWTFENNSNSQPSSEKERFETAHEQNLRRLRGDLEVYYGYDVEPSDLPFPYNLLFTYCYFHGVNASKALKRDLQPGLIHRITTVNIYKNYNKNMDLPVDIFYDSIYIEKHNVSRYLLDNNHLSPVCTHDGVLLQEESHLWRNLSLLVQELNRISENNGLIKTLILSGDLLNEMTIVLEDIIDIEETIIRNSQI